LRGIAKGLNIGIALHLVTHNKVNVSRAIQRLMQDCLVTAFSF
jgi:hypothetical protein